MGIPPVRGHLHPLMKVRAQYRQIFLEMGLVKLCCVSVCMSVRLSVCVVCLCLAFYRLGMCMYVCYNSDNNGINCEMMKP